MIQWALPRYTDFETPLLHLKFKLGCKQLDGRKTICEPRHDKTSKMTVRPAKTQISLGIRPVWSESSLCAHWVAKFSSCGQQRLWSESLLDAQPFCWFCRGSWVFYFCSFLLLFWYYSLNSRFIIVFGDHVISTKNSIIATFWISWFQYFQCISNHFSNHTLSFSSL